MYEIADTREGLTPALVGQGLYGPVKTMVTVRYIGIGRKQSNGSADSSFYRQGIED